MKNKNKNKQKIYCYVDETGQDSGSSYYITVVVVSAKDQEEFRRKLTEIEKTSRIGSRKWYKSRGKETIDYLQLFNKINDSFCKIFYNKYKKPIPFLFPTIEIINESIAEFVNKQDCRAIIYVDGIDNKKAQELTNALRSKGISLDYVRNTRDESEPCIRLADRWAGCIRDCSERHDDILEKITGKAKRLKILRRL
jgi:hypothetical protein